MNRFIKGKWYQSKATHRFFECVYSKNCEYAFRQSGTRNYLTRDFLEFDMLVFKPTRSPNEI